MNTPLVVGFYLSVYVAYAQLSPQQVDNSCDIDTRSVWKIILSCLATIFSCAWVSVHLNIPKQGREQGRGRGKLWKFGRRAAAFAAALIAPEFIVGKAWGQHISAKQMAAKYIAQGWPLTHGFFVDMGGFMVHNEGSGPDYVLDSDKINSVTYFLWWDKPLNVQRPITLLRVVGDNAGADRRQSVGMFGEHTAGSDYMLSAFGVLFGGIHCIAWTVHFPTIWEKFLWQGACVTITTLPAVVAVLTVTTSKKHFLPASLINFLFAFPTVVYIIARLILFALAISTLRSLSPDAHTTVRWSYFIPHI